MVHTEGRHGTPDADPIPNWLERDNVYRHFCQCHLLGPRHADWHRHGSLYSNVVRMGWEIMNSRRWNCCRQRPFPMGCNNHIMNTEIATQLARITIPDLRFALPSVPQRGEPLASVLRSRKLGSNLERVRFRNHERWQQRRRARGWWSDSDEWSESDEFESS